MADLEIIAGKLYINNEEVVLKSDTISRTQIVDFGTVVNNTRTVLPNPFFDGVNDADIAVACTARAEILVGGKWCGTKINASTSATWNGAEASTVAEGIVLQTALSTLNSNNTNRTGVAYGSQVTSAPCRVIVTYHGDLILPSSAIVKPEYIDSRLIATATVNFNGGATPLIKDNVNVSSVTKGGQGEFLVTFERPMDNLNYTLGGSAHSVTNAGITVEISSLSGSLAINKTLTSVLVRTIRTSDASADNVDDVSVIIFGGKNV